MIHHEYIHLCMKIIDPKLHWKIYLQIHVHIIWMFIIHSFKIKTYIFCYHLWLQPHTSSAIIFDTNLHHHLQTFQVYHYHFLFWNMYQHWHFFGLLTNRLLITNWCGCHSLQTWASSLHFIIYSMSSLFIVEWS